MHNLREIKKDTIKVPYTMERETMRFVFNGEPLTVVEIAKRVNKSVGMVYYRLRMGLSPDADLSLEAKGVKKYLIEGIEYTMKELTNMWLAKWGGKCTPSYTPSSMIYGRIKLRTNPTLGMILKF